MESLRRAAGYSQRDITLDLLEGVAKVRYALLVVAGLFQQQVSEVGGASPASHAHIVHGAMANPLLEEARQACTMEGVNTIDSTGERNTTGPIVYLLKMIVRQWGFGCLKKVVERHQWVVPVELRQDEVREGGREVDGWMDGGGPSFHKSCVSDMYLDCCHGVLSQEKTVDPFVMYNPVYSPLREVVNAAAYGKAFDRLVQTTEVGKVEGTREGRRKGGREGGREGGKREEEKDERVEKRRKRSLTLLLVAIACLSTGSPASAVCSSAAWCV